MSSGRIWVSGCPDNIIIPTGAGSNVLGCDLAFRELLAAGEIDRLPRLFVAQPVNCAPIDAAFRAGADGQVETEFAPTIAEGTAIKDAAPNEGLAGGDPSIPWRNDRHSRGGHSRGGA